MLSRDVLKITLNSAAAEEIIINYITFLDPGGINYVIIVGPTVSNYHPFQNHYTHEIIIFELFRGLQLQLSGVVRIN